PGRGRPVIPCGRLAVLRGRFARLLGWLPAGPGRHIEDDLPVGVEQQPGAERPPGLAPEAGQDLVGAPVLQELARLLGGDGAAGELLPDDEAAAGLGGALPAGAAVGPAVLPDDVAGLRPAAGAESQLDPLRAEVAGLQVADLLHGAAGEVGDALHEL